MTDGCLPSEEMARPLKWVFLDVNSYFATVEQQLRPELRGRPVAIAPVDAETTFCIAASYEAKKFGIRTGTMVRIARELCPDLVVVHTRTDAYIHFHRRIIEVASTVLPLDKVCSIDEMRFTLLGKEREPETARKIGAEMKRRILKDVGSEMRCSVGIAPNHYLAKVATEMQKPDGLVVLTADDLPHALHRLDLMTFTGINRRMQARLHAAGIFDAKRLCAVSRQELRGAFRSVLGERWWWLLRGYDIPPEEHARKTLGHSHVLAPERRTDRGCREVLLRLIQKAAGRLRAEGLVTEAMDVRVSGYEESWGAHTRFDPTSDTLTLNAVFDRLWATREIGRPHKVGVTFTDLSERSAITPSLFDQTPKREGLMSALDGLNGRYGRNAVFLAGMESVRHEARDRIAFQKVDVVEEEEIAPWTGGRLDTFRAALR